MIDNNRPAGHAKALRDLLEAAADVNNEAVELVAKGSLHLAIALEELGYVPDWQDRSEAIYRGRALLKAAYQNHPIDSYRAPYIESMIAVLPKVLLGRSFFRPDARPKIHLDRLDLWLNGASRLDIAEVKNLSYAAVHHWPTKRFPEFLRRNLSFYDVARAADRLCDVQELSQIK